MAIRSEITVIAALTPTVAAIFYLSYLSHKYVDILTPSYVGTCYQSHEYLQSYITAMIISVGLAGLASTVSALAFRNIDAFGYLCLCGFLAFISGGIGISLFATGSC